MKHILLAATVLFGAISSDEATAGDYWALALESLDVSSESGYGGTSVGEISGLTLSVGRTYSRGAFVWGVEGGAMFNFGEPYTGTGTFAAMTCEDYANGPYMCDLKANVRIVGLLGWKAGATTVYGKLGYGAAYGEFATHFLTQDTGVIRGMTYGLGISREVNDQMSVFGEMIEDDYRDARDQPGDFRHATYEASGLRIGFKKTF